MRTVTPTTPPPPTTPPRRRGRAPAALIALGAAAVVLAAATASGCKSQRRFGERKPLAQAYHNFTAHYNGYFNANELVEGAEADLAAAQQLDYSELLPVYPAYDAEDPAAASANLDKAMEKVSLVVNIHRPSSYDDDSYLLLGRAQLLKQDYEDAEHTFEFAVKDFDPANETARLRRIEKEKQAAGKSKAKRKRSSRARPSRRAPASRAPRRKPSDKDRKRQRKEAESKKAAGKKAAGGKRDAPERRRPEVRKKDKRVDRGKKPKSRAEMAKEQRERKLAEAKAAARAEAKAERDAEAARVAAAKKAADEARERAEKAARKDPMTGETVAAAGGDEAGAAGDPAGGGLAEPTTAGTKERSGPFVHESALQDLSLWLARTYIAREKYVDAERELGKLARSGSTFKHVRRELPAAYAQLYIRRGREAEAVPYLTDAIELSRDRADRARYAFIRGQINTRLGNAREAYADFERVIKLKPAFEMAFNAELNLATTAYRTGSEDYAATLRGLRRMTREDKYDEYRDRIFFTMAEIALDAGDRPEGIAYLRQGLAANNGNQREAARAYLKLGDLFFADEDYVLASNYYDSTLQVLPKTDARYAEVDAYRTALKPIAANLETIAREDSLLAVAALSPADQRALAERIEADRREAARQAAIDASRAETAGAAGTPSRATRRAGAPETTFFAYDDRALRRGRRAFERRFGDRPLVDNWRTRDSRESAAALDDPIAQLDDGVAGEEEIAAILADVPNDEAAEAAALGKIETALASLGRQYRDKLDNPAKAAEALEELLRRFPESDYAAEALYLSALAYDDLGRPADARAARERLKREHADTKYAKSLIDPDFVAGARDEQARLVAYYDDTYALFQSDRADEAAQRLAGVEAEFGADNDLQPRFALLGALVAGKREGRDAYIASLRQVVAKHPQADEATRAKEILRLLGERAGATADLDKAAQTGGQGNPDVPFQLTPDKSHYALIAIDKGASLSKAKAAVADYNAEFHRLDKLAIGNVYMVRNGEQTPVVVVRRFKSQDEAMNYFASLGTRLGTFMKDIAYEPLIVSQSNYREILRSKALAEYERYFGENYL